MGSELPERVVRLEASTDWWCRLLNAVATRMSERMEAGWWHSFFEEHSEEELEGYFSRDEIDALLEQAGDPELEYLRSDADAMFVVGALYQINGFLGQLAKEQQVWRGDLADDVCIGPLSLAQLICVVGACISILVLYLCRNRLISAVPGAHA